MAAEFYILGFRFKEGRKFGNEQCMGRNGFNNKFSLI